VVVLGTTHEFHCEVLFIGGQVLGAQYRALRTLLPRLTVMGGCCGTDHRHVEAICSACLAA